MTKISSRNDMIEFRKSLSSEERSLLFNKILKRFFEIPEYINARKILAYYGIESNGEFNTIPLLDKILDEKKELFLPRCVNKKIELDIYEISDLQNQLRFGSFNIKEPIHNLTTLYPKDKLNVIDLIIVPGLLFDKAGNRYGYGKGYYDSLLKNYHGIKVAFALTEAISDIPLKTHSLDIPISIIITPKKIIHI